MLLMSMALDSDALQPKQPCRSTPVNDATLFTVCLMSNDDTQNTWRTCV